MIKYFKNIFIMYTHYYRINIIINYYLTSTLPFNLCIIQETNKRGFKDVLDSSLDYANRRYIAEILPIRRKILFNQSINYHANSIQFISLKPFMVHEVLYTICTSIVHMNCHIDYDCLFVCLFGT